MTGPNPEAQLTSDVEWIAHRLASLALIHPNAERVDDEILAIRATLQRLAADNEALRQPLKLRLDDGAERRASENG